MTRVERRTAHFRIGLATASATLVAASAYAAFTSTEIDCKSGASEPGVAVSAKTGHVFVDAPIGLLGPSMIWKSTDGGPPFTVITPPTVGASNVTIGGGDADLAIDAKGNLYFVDLWLVDASAVMSPDEGATWTGIPLGTVPIQDRPWVAADPRAGKEGMVYSVTEQIPTGLFLSKNLPGLLPGVVYPISVPEILNAERGLIGAAPPGNVVTNAKGDTYSVYSIFTGSNGGGIGLSMLPDGGLLTTNGSVAAAADTNDPTQSFPVVAVDTATATDNVYVVWADPVSDTQWDVRFASSSDQGRTWSAAVTLGHGLYPWITAIAPGQVDVAWYSGEGYAGNPNVAPPTTNWDVVVAKSSNAASLTPAFTSPAVVAAAVKKGPVCTAGISCSGDRELGDFLSIAHDAAGKALIGYVFVPMSGASCVELAKEN